MLQATRGNVGISLPNGLAVSLVAEVCQAIPRLRIKPRIRLVGAECGLTDGVFLLRALHVFVRGVLCRTKRQASKPRNSLPSRKLVLRFVLRRAEVQTAKLRQSLSSRKLRTQIALRGGQRLIAQRCNTLRALQLGACLRLLLLKLRLLLRIRLVERLRIAGVFQARNNRRLRKRFLPGCDPLRHCGAIAAKSALRDRVALDLLLLLRVLIVELGLRRVDDG